MELLIHQKWAIRFPYVFLVKKKDGLTKIYLLIDGLKQQSRNHILLGQTVGTIWFSRLDTYLLTWKNLLKMQAKIQAFLAHFVSIFCAREGSSFFIHKKMLRLLSLTNHISERNLLLFFRFLYLGRNVSIWMFEKFEEWGKILWNEQERAISAKENKSKPAYKNW